MKRRIFIYGGALALYAALMSVAWTIGTQQAHRKTEAMLDYAMNDIRVTMDGVIDTMLDHLAASAVRHFGKAEAFPSEEVAKVARAFDIDELNIVDRTGHIIAANDRGNIGVDMAAKKETGEFLKLTNGTTSVVSQPFRRNAYGASRRKYLGVPFPGGDGFLQAALDEKRMRKMISAQLAFLFDAEVEETVCYLCADIATDALVSKSLEDGMAHTLAGIGFDASKAPGAGMPLPNVHGKESNETFVQTMCGRQVFCRSFIFGGHRFIVAEPKNEFYGTRDMITAAMAALLALVLGGFAFFLVRISDYAERIRAFYAAEDAARAKDMEIAKDIQSSALPSPLESSPYFRLSASMTPARDVGGDFYDFFMLDQTHLAFIVADVSGKGITAALYMMTAKTVIKGALLAARDPADAFTRANAELCRNNTANMFLTAWAGILDLETGTVTFANAGHNPPIRTKGREKEWLSAKSGPMLAFMEGIKYKPRTVHLDPGDSLFLYTDGVTEATDAEGELFGEERLSTTLAAAQQGNPESVCKLVRIAVAAFASTAPAADDITVLAVEYVSSPDRFVRSFPPTQEGVAGASAFLDESLEKFSAKGRADGIETLAPPLHIIVDEIASNIVKHSGASGFEVDIELLGDKNEIKLSMVDDGTPYDPLAHADPDTSLPAEKRPIGGLGILMVKKIADSVAYERSRNRNCLTIQKRIS